MKIVSGAYAHDVGWTSTNREDVTDLAEPDEWVAREEITVGAYYEMTNPGTWHRVRPMGRETYTLMIAGEPYARKVAFPKPDQKQPRLSAKRRQHVLHLFRSFYVPEYGAAMDADSYG